MTLLGAVAVAVLVHGILIRLARRWSERTDTIADEAAIQHGRRPARFILILAALFAVLPALPLDAGASDLIHQILVLAEIAAVGWLVFALVEIIDDVAEAKFSIDVEDNLQARRIRTQVRILRRAAKIIVAILTAAIMLMTFPEVRRVGEGLFASAGIAALIAGLAARPTIMSLIAGVQLALTEPIRIDDVVVVEGEWGRIEEIGPTYVIVRLWDLRRLIVPLSYFIEQPFENWTRQTANLLATVKIYADYTVPVEEVRQELLRILEASGMWNGDAWALQVTDATERTIELRALMSARNSSIAWDLRCHVREKLIEYLRVHHPYSLARERTDIRSVQTPESAKQEQFAGTIFE